MPATESAQGKNWKRKFEIRREADKKSPPRFCEWVKEPPESLPKGCLGVLTIPKAGGKDSHYLLFGGWSGTLIDLRVEEVAYGDQKPEKHLIASLDDEADVVEIHLPFFKTYSRDFMKRLLGPNFNPKSSLSMSPYAMDNKDGGAQNVGISCLSGANKLSAKASDFGGSIPDAHLVNMPRPTKVLVGDDEITNYTDQVLWLWAQLQSSVVPNLLKFGETVQRVSIPAPSAATNPITTTTKTEPHFTQNAATSAGFEGLNAPPPGDLDGLPF